MKSIGLLTLFVYIFLFMHYACSTQFDTEDDAEDTDAEMHDQVTDNPDAPDGDDATDPDGTDAADTPSDTVEEEEVVIPPNCGDGNVDDDEDCDDGNDVNGDGCDNDCSWSCEENGDCDDGHPCTDDVCDDHVCDNSPSGDSTVCRDPVDSCDRPEFCDGEGEDCPEDKRQEDGFVCDEDPRSICLDGACGESTCGDGFVDEGGGEFCEPPGEEGCNEDCGFDCESSEDCPNDSEDCNGEEYCNLDVNKCERRNPLEDGSECGDSAEREICISESCQPSSCGDGFIDGGADPAEECEDGNGESGDGCEPGDCRFSCHTDSEDEDCYDDRKCTNDKCNTETHMCENPPEGADVLCRESTRECDEAEYCDGESPDCPDDGFRSPGSSCGDPNSSECDGADTCDSDGYCQDNLAGEGAYCGDDTDIECDSRDTCDGEGSCQDNIWSYGESCGDPTEEDCNNRDTCDGEGGCMDNYWEFGDSCGDPETTECSGSDFCNGEGYCNPNHYDASVTCGSSDITECSNRDTCDGAGNCDPRNLDAGTGCGSGSSGLCTNPDTCDGDGNCLDNHLDDGTICGANSGACDNGECKTFHCALPGGYAWTHVGNGPRADHPSGCGSDSFPCNTGEFFFTWPPDTGQTECFDTTGTIISCSDCARDNVCGQDAQYGWDVTNPSWSNNRFTLSGPTVYDSATGLKWTYNYFLGELPTVDPLTFAEALDYCYDNTSGGETDWLLPDLYTLNSYVNLGMHDPATAFPDHPSAYFWSATSTSGSSAITNYYWSGGYITTGSKDGSNPSVRFGSRCVTNDMPYDWPGARYYLSEADDIVYDTRTCLMWRRYVWSGHTWPQALDDCENTTHGGISDWRLPNFLELRSILDLTRNSPAIDSGAFPSTPNGYYWSSTTVYLSPARDRAWRVTFVNGMTPITSGYKSSDTGYVRCVAMGP